MYRYVSKAWRGIWGTNASQVRSRLISWRHGPTIVREEKPLRIDRARAVGYKAKQGFVAVRARVSRGGMRKQRPRAGRRQKHLGVVRIKAAVSSRTVAERRACDKYPNLKVLNSYFLYKDGRYAWYEVIMVDPSHPSVEADKNLKWLKESA